MSTSGPPFPQTKQTPLFVAFSKEVKRIHQTWLVWYRLFRDEDAPHELGVFNKWNIVWHHVFHSLAMDVILSICRLVDPSTMKKRSNLTVERVWNEMASFSGRANLMRAAEATMSDFSKEVDQAGLRKLRHRYFAHNDLETMLGNESHSANIELLRMAVEWLTLFQWRCESLYEGRPVRYDKPVSGVHRDYATDREVEAEVDKLMEQLAKYEARGPHAPGVVKH